MMLFAAFLIEAGANYAHLWARPEAEVRETVALMKRSNLKVLRIFLSASGDFPDVEDPLGAWNDRILERVDFLLSVCAPAGIRVIVCLHDHWMLGKWGQDAYVRKWPEPLMGKNGLTAINFYMKAEAREAFRNRLRHILAYEGPHTRKKWPDLGDVIYAWEPQNEPNWRAHLPWTEEMSKLIKELAPKHRVAMGGLSVALRGAEKIVAASPSVDLWAYHWYGWEPLEKVADKLDGLGIRWFIEEFDVRRHPEVVELARRRKVTWLFWCLSPEKGTFDVWEGSRIFDTVIVPAARD